MHTLDIVIPTRGRAPLMRRILPYYESLANVDSILIVADGEVPQELRDLASSRVHVLSTGTPMGAAGAKLKGICESRARYVGFGEDDVIPTLDYYRHLLNRVESGSVDACCGTVQYLTELSDDWSRGRGHRTAAAPWPRSTGAGDSLVYGPTTPATFVAPRELLLTYSPYLGYRVNGWREEADPLMQMWSASLRVAIDTRATCYHLPKIYQTGGGQHQLSRFQYEWWVLRNDLRFYNRHRDALVRLGCGRSGLTFALGEMASRWQTKLRSRVAPTELETFPLPKTCA
jgi:hypothetical protein